MRVFDHRDLMGGISQKKMRQWAIPIFLEIPIIYRYKCRGFPLPSQARFLERSRKRLKLLHQVNFFSGIQEP